MKTAIDFDDYIEERGKLCSQLTKPAMQSVSRRPRVEASELGPSSSKMLQQSELSPIGSDSTSKPLPKINSDRLSKTVSQCESSRTEKLPTDPCGRCGCIRKAHEPPKTFSYAKTGASSGKSHELPITARTCCWECKFCMCSCVAWVEPFEGQRFTRCVYAQ